VQQHPPGSGQLRAYLSCGANLALESSSDLGEDQSAKNDHLPVRRVCRPAASAGFAFQVLVSRPRGNRDHARDIPRATLGSLNAGHAATGQGSGRHRRHDPRQRDAPGADPQQQAAEPVADEERDVPRAPLPVVGPAEGGQGVSFGRQSGGGRKSRQLAAQFPSGLKSLRRRFAHVNRTGRVGAPPQRPQRALTE
jgi:hypothetical protein